MTGHTDHTDHTDHNDPRRASGGGAPDFDEQQYQRRVDELIELGMDPELARNEAWIEQHPGGDLIVERADGFHEGPPPVNTERGV